MLTLNCELKPVFDKL